MRQWDGNNRLPGWTVAERKGGKAYCVNRGSEKGILCFLVEMWERNGRTGLLCDKSQWQQRPVQWCQLPIQSNLNSVIIHQRLPNTVLSVLSSSITVPWCQLQSFTVYISKWNNGCTQEVRKCTTTYTCLYTRQCTCQMVEFFFFFYIHVLVFSPF